MSEIDRRKLLQTGVAGFSFALPLSGLLMLTGCQPSNDSASHDASASGVPSDSTAKKNQTESQTKTMQIKYLEIVTSEMDALCEQYSAMHGVTFSDPIANLGNARTAELSDGGLIGIRAPMRDSETPVVRPYMHVDNLEQAVAAAEKAGAEIAIPKMEIPGYAAIAIVIQGGIECGLWKDLQ